MRLIEESIVNNHIIKYYSGFDIDKVINHPMDGSNGMMVVFFDSIKNEEIKHQRHEIILNLLESKNIDNFSDILTNLNNNYLCLYETHGYTEIIYKSIKAKIEVIRDYDFQFTETIWG